MQLVEVVFTCFPNNNNNVMLTRRDEVIYVNNRLDSPIKLARRHCKSFNQNVGRRVASRRVCLCQLNFKCASASNQMHILPIISILTSILFIVNSTLFYKAYVYVCVVAMAFAYCTRHAVCAISLLICVTCVFSVQKQ